MKLTNSLFALVMLSGFLFACNSSNTNTQQDDTDHEEDHTSVMVDDEGPSLVGKEITYNDGETILKGYLAYDENLPGHKPGVIVVHEWWGNNEYAKMRADMLAELGYVAFALDMYGDGKVADNPDDAGAMAGEIRSNPELAHSRFMAAMDVLKNQNEQVDAGQIAAIGYCFGGGVVLTMANMGVDLDGVAAFHTSLPVPEKPKQVSGPILVCNGAADPLIDKETAAEYQEKLNAAGIELTYIEYPDALHAFTNPKADETQEKFDMAAVGYNEAADKASWEELEGFLAGLF